MNAHFEVKLSGCWEWARSRNKHGYGRYGRPGRSPWGTLAHRAAYHLTVGDIPPGVRVLHRCDNPPCVNPLHLFLGSSADNVRDMVAKSRQPSGSSHGRAKLNERIVIDMRARHAFGISVEYLAAKHGVSAGVARKAISGATWKMVPVRK